MIKKHCFEETEQNKNYENQSKCFEVQLNENSSVFNNNVS